jgi:5'-deoxynucleotidase YfbR-like HD superfamily hydrolase
MSRIDVLKQLAETNTFAAELLAARQRAKEKVKIEKQAALEAIQEPEKVKSDLDRLLDNNTPFVEFVELANKLDGITKG